MVNTLRAHYESTNDLAAHLAEFQRQGVGLLPVVAMPDGFDPTARVSVIFEAQDQRHEIGAEIVQVLEGAGIVLRLLNTQDVHFDGEAKAGRPTPTGVHFEAPSSNQSIDTPVPNEDVTPHAKEEVSEDPDETIAGIPKGSSVLALAAEKLEAQWDQLTTPEKIRVARYGNRGHRMVVRRSQDKGLLAHLLTNPHLSIDEVATLAGMPALDPATLRRIASNPEWLRSGEVVRNLVTNPKLPTPDVERLLRTMNREELKRVAQSGRLRANMKQVIDRMVKTMKP